MEAGNGNRALKHERTRMRGRFDENQKDQMSIRFYMNQKGPIQCLCISRTGHINIDMWQAFTGQGYISAVSLNGTKRPCSNLGCKISKLLLDESLSVKHVRALFSPW